MHICTIWSQAVSGRRTYGVGECAGDFFHSTESYLQPILPFDPAGSHVKPCSISTEARSQRI